MISPRFSAGSASERSRSTGSSSGQPREITGNQRKWIAKTSSIRMPETNAGNDRPASETMRATQSPKPSRRRAAITPNGTPTMTPMSSDATVSSIVNGSTAATSVTIERLVISERPRSPLSTWPMKARYWRQIGWSRPILARSSRSASGVAWSPMMTSAGSPGTMRTSTKTSVSTASSVGSA